MSRRFPVFEQACHLQQVCGLLETKASRDAMMVQLDTRYPGDMPIDLGEDIGQPSRWITLRALRVLDWYAGRDQH